MAMKVKAVEKLLKFDKTPEKFYFLLQIYLLVGV
jgi:hypothetical protein